MCVKEYDDNEVIAKIIMLCHVNNSVVINYLKIMNILHEI